MNRQPDGKLGFATKLKSNRGHAAGRHLVEEKAQQRAALIELLGKRRSGPFVSAAKMDDRLSRMIDRKRWAHATRR